jgi:FKBP-type peptidyl-prolyl cis-trans isomerase FkpA
MRYLPMIFVFIFFLGCSKEKNLKINTNAPHQIQEDQYVLTKTGLKYADLKAGSGREAKSGDNVSVHYAGWLTNGNLFDTSYKRNQTFNFQLGTGMVIAGWDEGVSGMKIGGIRQLVIPPELGYGARGAGGIIPPNASLIFEVELMEIQ